MSSDSAQSVQAGDWICVNCGMPHSDNTSPCRGCAGERFARVEDDQTPRVESTTSVEYQCKECGARQPRNSTPCKKCGGVMFDSVEVSNSATDDRFQSPSWNWLNPPGPFRAVRRYTAIVIVSSFVVSVLAFSFGIVPGLAAVWLVFIWPVLLFGIGAMWVIDNILGYLRHG